MAFHKGSPASILIHHRLSAGLFEQANSIECPDTTGEGHPCEGDLLIYPIIECANDHQPSGLGAVVVGAYVYRGSELPPIARALRVWRLELKSFTEPLYWL